MVTGEGTGIIIRLPSDAVDVLCNVMDDTVNVKLALVVELLADHEGGVIEIEVCAVSPVSELNQVTPGVLVEFVASRLELLEDDVTFEVLLTAGEDVLLGIDPVTGPVQDILDNVELGHNTEEVLLLPVPEVCGPVPFPCKNVPVPVPGKSVPVLGLGALDALLADEGRRVSWSVNSLVGTDKPVVSDCAMAVLCK